MQDKVNTNKTDTTPQGERERERPIANVACGKTCAECR